MALSGAACVSPPAPPELKRSAAFGNSQDSMNNGSKANKYLTRYWFMYPGLLGFGVTAFSVDDAFFLLEAEGYLIDKGTEIIADVDVSMLDRHVAPNAGPACFRG